MSRGGGAVGMTRRSPARDMGLAMGHLLPPIKQTIIRWSTGMGRRRARGTKVGHQPGTSRSMSAWEEA